MQIIPGSALGLAMVTVVGQCVGAGDYEQAKYYIKKIMKITYITTICIIALILFITPVILQFYSLSDETLVLANQCIYAHGIIGAIAWPMSFTFPNALRAANDAKFTMVVSALSMLICRLFFSYVIAKYMGFGLLGVWIAMFIDWGVRCTFFIWRYMSGKWMNRQLI